MGAGLPFANGCPTENGTTDLGYLSVVPSSGADSSQPVFVELAIGVDGQDPVACTGKALEGNPSCYVVRRKVRFESGRSLNLRVYVDRNCAGKLCDPSSSCYRGSCESVEATCEAGDCLTALERANGFGKSGGGADASVSDATLSDATLSDATLSDGGATDAAADAPKVDAGDAAFTCARPTPASPANLATSKAKCAGFGSSCCVGPDGAPRAVTPAGCPGQDTERWCTSACDCAPGSNCLDVVTQATSVMTARAACVRTGCEAAPGLPSWGRDGSNGNHCESGACCRSETCTAGLCE